MKRRYLLLAPILLTIHCWRSEPVAPGKPVVGKDAVILDAQTTQIIGTPENVRAYRILDPYDPRYPRLKKTHPLIDEQYPILEQKPVAALTSRRIANVLLDPGTYDPDHATDCTFVPSYALEFQRGRDIVTVVICFKCGDLDVISPTKRVNFLPFGADDGELWNAISTTFPTPRPSS